MRFNLLDILRFEGQGQSFVYFFCGLLGCIDLGFFRELGEDVCGEKLLEVLFQLRSFEIID